MSYWYEPKIKDLDISEDGKDLHVYLTNDDSGAVYASIRIEDIKAKISDEPRTTKP